MGIDPEAIGKANYVIVNTYPRAEGAGAIQDRMWDEHVPVIQQIPGFVAIATLETVEDDGAEGASLSYYETLEAAQQYLDSATRKATDEGGKAFRPAANRRIMRVLRSA